MKSSPACASRYSHSALMALSLSAGSTAISRTRQTPTYWYDRAMEWAQEANDTAMQGYVLSQFHPDRGGFVTV